MTIQIAGFRRQFTRRAALGGAAAMVAAPALAEECRIGSPPHGKGPLVWMDMDQVELDAAYDQAFYAPLRLEVIKRLASTSTAAQ
jgi:arylformamidase